MARTQRDLTDAGRAARALARSGLAAIRVPQDLPELTRHGFPEAETQGLAPLLKLGLVRPVARGLYEVRAVDPDAADYDTAGAAAMRLVRAAWSR